MPSEPGPRKVLLRLLSAAIGLLLALLLVEAILRVGDIRPPQLVTKRLLRSEDDPLLSYQCYTSDANGELRPPPDTRRGRWRLFNFMMPPRPMPLARLAETPYCVEYRRSVTASGKRLRGSSPTAVAAAGVTRILTIGDSFTFGEGVPEDRALPAQLGRLLGPRYELLNGGKVGADTTAEVAILDELGVELHADRAIFVFIPNDIALTPQLAARQDFIHDLINVRDEYLAQWEEDAWYTGHYRFLHLIGSALALRRIKRATVEWYLDSYEPAHNAPGLAQLEASLARLASAPGRRVAFVLYPLMEELEGRYPLGPIHDRVAGMARGVGLPVLDLLPAFRGQRTRQLWVHPSDHHPNGRAHGIAAKAIADWLRRELPGFLDRG